MNRRSQLFAIYKQNRYILVWLTRINLHQCPLALLLSNGTHPDSGDYWQLQDAKARFSEVVAA